MFASKSNFWEGIAPLPALAESPDVAGEKIAKNVSPLQLRQAIAPIKPFRQSPHSKPRRMGVFMYRIDHGQIKRFEARSGVH